jgi:SAM-dependent methyltransferase
MKGNFHVRFGERGGETRWPQGQKVRSAPTLRTGRNFPLILEKIGPTGKLLGVDYTPDMLARARERVERERWKNVELVQGDAACIELLTFI